MFSRGLVLALLILPIVYAATRLDRAAIQEGRGASSSDLSSFPFPEALDSYRYALVFHPDTHRLALTMDLQMMNRTDEDLHDLVLRTYAGAFSQAQTSPAAGEGLFDACYPNGFSPGDILVHDTRWNGEAVPAYFEDEARTVLRIAIASLRPGDWGTLTLRCVLTVPDCLYRFGRTEGIWMFGNCLPILSQIEGGQWRQDPYVSIGDPFVSNCADYEVSLSLPPGYSCAATAPLSSGGGSVSPLLEGQVRAARDFALAIFKDYAVREGMAGHVRVVSWAADAQSAQVALDFAVSALSSYSKRYGPYPWPCFTLVQTPFPFSGMEYPALAFIGAQLYAEDQEDSLELTIAHETAHQWFYALVGSDQYRQAWQDEALCEYAMLAYVLERYGVSAFENLSALRVDAPMRQPVREGISPASPLDDFLDLAEYVAVVYGRGAAAMQAIDLDTGGFDAFLREYVRQNAFGFASREDFSTLLNSFFSKDLTPLLSDYLDALP